ncbi:sigma-70 family RNA polymerase sigma factor [Candidatus Bipolaricaulota bacterium]|nr:sigma-70 family RNA polymerase sigma factor [Candidatus Bipolaricaulota bacterium]
MGEAKNDRLSELSNEELIRLLRLAIDGETDQSALALLREEIVKRNIGLVKSIAREFRNSGEIFDDLMQAGYIGLLNAVTNFDLARKIRFSTYASYLIKGEIRHYIRDKHTTVRIPQWIQAMNRKVKEVEEAFFQKHGRPPTIADLAARMEVDEAQIVELLRGRKAMTYVSIDQQRRRDDPNPTIPPDEYLRPHGETSSSDLRMQITVAIDRLAEIQRQVIDGLFYQGKSQRELGKELGMSQRQVSRMKEQALNEVKGRLSGSEN